MSKRYLIGVDPSFKTMGVAIKDCHVGTMKLYTGIFQDSIDFINKNCNIHNSIAIVENAAMINAVFKVWHMMDKEIDNYAESLAKHHLLKMKSTNCVSQKKSKEACRSQFEICIRYGISVGKQMAAAEQTILAFKSVGIEVLEISPSKRSNMKTLRSKAGKAKINLETVELPTKLNAAEFAQLTGYLGKSSEHSRDAAILVYNQTVESIYKKMRQPGLRSNHDGKVSIFSPDKDQEYYKSTDLSEFIDDDKDIFLK